MACIGASVERVTRLPTQLRKYTLYTRVGYGSPAYPKRAHHTLRHFCAGWNDDESVFKLHPKAFIGFF